MRKGDLRVDLLRVKDLGVGDFPILLAQAAVEAGLVAQLAGAAGGPHPDEQLVALTVESNLQHLLEVPRGLPLVTTLRF